MKTRLGFILSIFIVAQSLALPVRVEIARGWQTLHISSSSPFSLMNISTGELLNSLLREINLSFLKKTRKLYCLKLTCPSPEKAVEVERKIKRLVDKVERKGEVVVAKCELEVVRKVVQEQIKGEGIELSPYEEELEETSWELKTGEEERKLPRNARLRLILSSYATKAPFLFDVSINNAPIKRFRGELEIFVNDANIPELINELDLEDYLRGVLPGEISPDFPMECLKAQAIVARTYAVYTLGRHRKEGFDLCSSLHCQVYLGYDYEKEKLNRAIESTKGIIICYNGKPALTPFHSSCGGITENADVWGTSLPYLKVKPDGPFTLSLDSEEKIKKFLQTKEAYCEASPSFRWVRQYTEESLQKTFMLSLPLLLCNPALKVGRIKDMKVEERSPSGRVKSLRIEMDDGAITLRGDDIRWAFGDGKPASKESLPSLLFYIEKQESGDKSIFKIMGGGAGHGVGFCQWGAVGLAKKGYDYRQIINFYFPGTTLRNTEEK